MNDQGFTTGFSVAQTPEAVFNAINNVRGWWSGEIDGETDKLGAQFTYRDKDFHRTKQKIAELIPGKKVVCPFHACRPGPPLSMLRRLFGRMGHAH